MEEIITRFIDMPYSVNGFTVKDCDDNYNVYINTRISDWMQKATMEHELSHIRLGHFFSENPVFIKEEEVKR